MHAQIRMRTNRTLLAFAMTAAVLLSNCIPTVVSAWRRSYCEEDLTSRYAIVTLLTTISAEYVELAVILGYSITMNSDVDCRVDRILVIRIGDDLPNAARQQLEFAGWTVVQMPAIPSPGSVNVNTVKHARYLGCFSKLHVFNMTQYDTVLFLDADTMVCGRIMSLFTAYAPRMHEHGAHLAWVRDSPDVNNPKSPFNAGVMLIRPSATLAEQLVANTEHVVFDPFMVEQSYLAAIFNATHDAHAGSFHQKYDILPQKYNLLAHIATVDPALWQTTHADARIFHFTWLKPTVSFLALRCAYMGTLHFCNKWAHIRFITRA